MGSSTLLRSERGSRHDPPQRPREMIFVPCPKSKCAARLSDSVCRAKGCHLGCNEYHRHTVRLPKEIAAWCRYFTALKLEDNY